MSAQQGVVETHQRLSEIWDQVLGSSGVDSDSDLLELGGDSLDAIRICGWVRKVFGVEISAGDVLTDSSFAAMAALVDERIERSSNDA